MPMSKGRDAGEFVRIHRASMALAQRRYVIRHRLFPYLSGVLFFSPGWRSPILRDDPAGRFWGQHAGVVLKLLLGEVILSEQVEMPP